MEVNYKSNIKNNYIVLNNPDIVVNDFRLKMLLKNKIKGFLNIYVGCVDGEVELSYLIDSKQSLKQLFERKKMNNEEVVSVIKGIIEILNVAEQYLLKPDDIMLEMDLIFSDYDMKEVWFCYYPNSQKVFSEEIKKLSQELLIITEHSDLQAVETIYKFFDICNGKDISVSRLEKCLDNEKYKYDSYIKEDFEMNMVCEKEEDIYNIEVKKGKIGVLIEKFYNFFAGKGKDGYLLKKEEKILKENDIESMIEGKVEAEFEYENETMLVSDILINTNRKLLSLSDKSDIEITNYPFIIGKLNARADYIFDDKLISRMHLKIYKEGEEFFLEDMNSKNGTYVNEIQLNPYEKRKIEIGDKITIAKYEFILR